ncbi:hypothetical protein V8C44DRAFT_337300 [Trichoderma aethiopicum]
MTSKRAERLHFQSPAPGEIHKHRRQQEMSGIIALQLHSSLRREDHHRGDEEGLNRPERDAPLSPQGKTPLFSQG